MRVVAALGGNALLRRGEPLDPSLQERNVDAAAAALADLAADHELVITHGNGPQVGLLALHEAAEDHPLPLDVLGAESEGMIGYLVEQALGNLLPGRWIATLLTRTEVDPPTPRSNPPASRSGPSTTGRRRARWRRAAAGRSAATATAGGVSCPRRTRSGSSSSTRSSS